MKLNVSILLAFMIAVDNLSGTIINARRNQGVNFICLGGMTMPQILLTLFPPPAEDKPNIELLKEISTCLFFLSYAIANASR